MKIHSAFFALITLALFSACGIAPAGGRPIEIPTVSVQIPFLASQTPIPSPVMTSTETPTPTSSPTVTSTPTETLTSTPKPTRKSPYPVGVGTLLPDLGFQEISFEKAPDLKPVFRIMDQNFWHSAISRDGTKLFAATSNGMLVYDRQGKQLTYWPSIILYQSCKNCLSVNRDGNRFALMTRKDGKWEMQVYNVNGEDAALLYKLPIEAAFRGDENEVRVALSPDGLLLAYGTADGDTVVMDLSSIQPVFTVKGKADALIFTPDGVSFAIQRGRELLFWKTATWKNPTNLLLPADDSPYAFSPDGDLIAIATSTRIRVFALDKLTPTREITILPTSVVQRIWQLVFKDETTLQGYSIRWDGSHTKATVETGTWNAITGETLKMETTETDAPDALSALWGAVIPATSAPGEIKIGQYDRLNFISLDSLLINSLHSACWLKLSIGAKICFDDPQNRVLASDGGAFREILQDYNTLLQHWNGGNTFDIGPHRIIRVNKNADYIVVNVNDATTDIYYKAKKLPVESIAGSLLTYVENADLMVFSTRGKSTLVSITVVEKKSMSTSYQKKDDFILKPLAITNNGKVYFVQQDPDPKGTGTGKPQVILKMIDEKKNYPITDVARLPMPAEPQVMALSSFTGLFAFGLQDGTVMLVSPDGQQTAIFQAAYSPIGGISFTGDGRYLAVGSMEGIKIFAVLPEK